MCSRHGRKTTRARQRFSITQHTLTGQQASSPIPSHKGEETDEKDGSRQPRCSAIRATLTEGISKLSGPQWIQKVDNLECSRRNVSEIKLKRTDTTCKGGQ